MKYVSILEKFFMGYNFIISVVSLGFLLDFYLIVYLFIKIFSCFFCKYNYLLFLLNFIVVLFE